MTRLYRVILPVADIDKATSFYSFVLEMEGERVSTGRHYFNCGGTILACFDPKADGDNFEVTPNPDHVYFSVDKIELVHKRVKESGCLSVDNEIKKQPWGERCFYAKDPFGNPICFVDEESVFTSLK
jgi:predicted enzyme related to lactoylglutathione lyase